MTDRGTPCESSSTVSLSGNRVPATRARRSSSSTSGMSIVNGRIVVSPAERSVMTAMWSSSWGTVGVVTGRDCAPSGGGFAVWQLPARPREVAVVTARIALQVVLVLGLGHPKRDGRADLGHDRAGPQA